MSVERHIFRDTYWNSARDGVLTFPHHKPQPNSEPRQDGEGHFLHKQTPKHLASVWGHTLDQHHTGLRQVEVG